MTLSEAVVRYVSHKQSMGMRFATEQRTLRSICRKHGQKDLRQLTPEHIRDFLAGDGPLTSFWHRKHGALLGFYRFAISRGYASHSPLPTRVPRLPRRFVPYIFSRAEVKRLLDAADHRQSSRCLLEGPTCRTLLLLLYGAGLRISEALSLTLADVDLNASLLHVRDSKFYKTRIVPIGPDLRGVVAQHVARRKAAHAELDAPLFVTRTGNGVTRRSAEDTFRRLRVQANVLRHDGARYQPRLHDLRHAYATHRLLACYQSGGDVQRLLPQLATYLGHIHIVGTQRYLTLTPQLLREAGKRFERYALGERHE
jgi:integrase/recombinase XerD